MQSWLEIFLLRKNKIRNTIRLSINCFCRGVRIFPIWFFVFHWMFVSWRIIFNCQLQVSCLNDKSLHGFKDLYILWLIDGHYFRSTLNFKKSNKAHQCNHVGSITIFERWTSIQKQRKLKPSKNWTPWWNGCKNSLEPARFNFNHCKPVRNPTIKNAAVRKLQFRSKLS